MSSISEKQQRRVKNFVERNKELFEGLSEEELKIAIGLLEAILKSRQRDRARIPAQATSP